MTFASPCASPDRSIGSIIWLARLPLAIISAIPSARCKTCVVGAITCLRVRRRQSRAGFCKPRPARSTEIPRFIRSPKTYVGHVNPIGPRACYDEGKRAAETLFFDYHRLIGRDQGRPHFQYVRPRMLENDGRVVSNFVVQALRNRRSRSTATEPRPASFASLTTWSPVLNC